MWAVVLIQRRSSWIHHETIRRTRYEAVTAYLAMWEPAYHGEILRGRNKRWRTERVRVECLSERT
jgi:hypothetical protein